MDMDYSMVYNTSNEKLVFKEYGRNVQRLVNYAKTIEDREKRTQMAYAIVNLMGQMHPHLRNIEEFRHKLWDQLQVIAKFDLDIDAPYPIPKSMEEVATQRDTIPYPQSRIKFKHYGKNVEHLIEKAVIMEDPDKRMAFAKVIASYMKMVYRNWNSDSVSDELIISDLYSLSDGKLDLSNEGNLEIPKAMKRRKQRVMTNNNGGSSHKTNSHSYKSNSNGSKRRNYR